MSQYFPKSYESFRGYINVKVDLCNYEAKAYLNATETDASKFTIKSNLLSLKTEVNKINADKLKTASLDLSKLKKAVNNVVAKKTLYDKLAEKVKNIDASKLLLETKYETDKSNLL